MRRSRYRIGTFLALVLTAIMEETVTKKEAAGDAQHELPAIQCHSEMCEETEDIRQAQRGESGSDYVQGKGLHAMGGGDGR